MAVETGVFRAESDFGQANLWVKNFQLEIEEDGAPTNRIIHIPGPTETAKDINFKMRWEMEGAAIQNGTLAKDLHWHARVYFEKIGPDTGPNPKFGAILFIPDPSLPAPPLPKLYTDTITFKSNEFTEGIYKYVVTLNMYKWNHPVSIIHSYFQADQMVEAIVGHNPMSP